MSTLAIPQTATTTWNIDPAHSVAEFKVKHMMISNVKGQFAKVSGVLTLDESELTNSRVEALIEAASIETRDAQRDAHLKSADFFDVEKFPALSFKSTRLSLVRDGELAAECSISNHQDQPQRLRPDLERGARDRRHSGGRRNNGHTRRPVREGINNSPRSAVKSAARR